MKNLTLIAAALLVAGAANAQNPITSFTHAAETPETAVTNRPSNNLGADQTAGAIRTLYSDYNQDSRVSQAGLGNYAGVDQSDTRNQSTLRANTGSSAIIDQTGTYSNAFQTQVLDASSNNTLGGQGRNLLRSTQAGFHNQSTQTQTGGYYNTAEVAQGPTSSNNHATQTQTGGNENSARIQQHGTSSGNFAKQDQSGGGTDNTALINQEGYNSYASQSQTVGTSNDMTANQGSRGTGNTSKQFQTGDENRANITQSTTTTGGDNYAEQNQKGYGDQASIEQQGSHSFAKQDQNGSFYADPNNESKITQSNVASAAYTTQSGYINTAVINQH